ncbi:hypothetical protein J3459_021641 [Metarhizium acridum]|nr:hypothetical protein J3459_021641 [Metarhizium acridum]
MLRTPVRDLSFQAQPPKTAPSTHSSTDKLSCVLKGSGLADTAAKYFPEFCLQETCLLTLEVGCHLRGSGLQYLETHAWVLGLFFDLLCARSYTSRNILRAIITWWCYGKYSTTDIVLKEVPFA